MLARYFMFAQVYYHPTRMAYNEHLKDFLSAWLPDGVFPIDAEDHLSRTDSEVLTAIRDAAGEAGAPGHEAAQRIVNREHFRIATTASLTTSGRGRWPRELSRRRRESTSAPTRCATERARGEATRLTFRSGSGTDRACPHCRCPRS